MSQQTLSRSDLFKRYGIILDSLGAKGDNRKELRKRLIELFSEEFSLTVKRARDLNDNQLLTFVNWVVMTLGTEFGIEVDLPNKFKISTKGLTLTEYKNLLE